MTAHIAAVITSWQARGVPDEAVDFARRVVVCIGPRGPARARALLWACSRLAAFGLSVGLECRPEVLLHPSVVERFVLVGMASRSAAARRTARTNLRFVGARVVPEVPQRPWPAALPRDRAKVPYTEAEVAGYFALARAQATEDRRQHLIALLCLGLGAGLDGADLRHTRGRHVVQRSGGVVVVVEGGRPRVVPVLQRYQAPLLKAAAFAADGYICGGRSPTRRNITAPLTGRLAGGTDLPRLDVGRLRATWLAEHIERFHVATFLAAAGVVCSQRLGDLARHAPAIDEAEAVALLGGAV